MTELQDINLNLLIILEAVYDAGSISGAGRTLSMTQPAVSNALGRLRKLMGEELFVREGRGIVPTVAAERLIGPVREALALVRGQLSNAEPLELAAYRRQFRILLYDAFEPLVLPSLLRELSRAAPEVSIECVRPLPDIIDGLNSGRIDIACFAGALSAPEIHCVPLRRLDSAVVARSGHPRLQSGMDRDVFNSLGHVVLLPEPFPDVALDSDLAAGDLTRQMRYTVKRAWSVAAIVESTDLLGVLPRWFATAVSGNFQISIHDLPARVPERWTYMHWHSRNTEDPGHTWLREQVLSVARDESG